MAVVNPAELLWQAACSCLKEQVADGVWLGVFSDTQGLYLDENCLTIAAPNAIVRDRIEQRYRELVLEIDDGDNAPLTTSRWRRSVDRSRRASRHPICPPPPGPASA